MVTYFGLAPEVDSCNDEILSCVGAMACVVCAGGGPAVELLEIAVWSGVGRQGMTEARWRMMIGAWGEKCEWHIDGNIG
jgi:hypothetical protein